MREWMAQYWLQALFGGMLAALAAGYRRLARKVRVWMGENAAVKEGVVAILHDRLYAECRRCIALGNITVEELRNVEYLYTAYHALGGNGTGTELYNRVRRLDIARGGPAGQ